MCQLLEQQAGRLSTLGARLRAPERNYKRSTQGDAPYFRGKSKRKREKGGYKRDQAAGDRFLLVDLFVDSVGCLGLLLVQEGADPRESLVANDKRSDDGGLSVGDEAWLLVLLVFRAVHLKDVIPSLEALVVGEKDEALGIVVELLGGLHDNGEFLVDAVEGLVAEGVDLLDVRRDILVGPLEPGKNGSGKGLVSGVAELDRLLSVFVGLESVDAVANDGVVEEMLEERRVSSAHITVDLRGRHCDEFVCMMGEEPV